MCSILTVENELHSLQPKSNSVDGENLPKPSKAATL